MYRTKNKLIGAVIIVIGSLAFAGNLYAGNAYSYFNLYKNSEIYKERHPEERDTVKNDEDRGPQFDGWGNLKDDPPPPPPDYDYDEYDDVEDGGTEYGGMDSGDN